MVGSRVLQAVDLSVIWPLKECPILWVALDPVVPEKTRSHLALSGGPGVIRLTGQGRDSCSELFCPFKE